jgi:ribosomal peptide maturation radical SAM protein 1
MPFANVQLPSIAITQLQTVIKDRFPGEADVRLFYFNHEVATYLDPLVYDFITNNGASNNSGFGDWFFRQEAFPQLEDNTAAFFARYGSLFGSENTEFYYSILQDKRDGLGYFLDQLVRDHDLAEYNIVGFTSMFMQTVPSIALARKIKAYNEKVLVVMGGANCESPMGEEIVRNVDVVDYVFSGIALRSLPMFVESVLNGRSEMRENINGVFSKGNTRALLRTAGDELPLDESVSLDYDSFLESYREHLQDMGKKPYLALQTSRGCWWGAKAHCTFCGLNGNTMAYRAMKTETAIKLFNGMFGRYASQVDHFFCVDNIIPKEYITDVFPRLDVPENVSMFYEVRADLTPADMTILVKAGILEVQPGIESLATSTLKLMKKGASAFNNIRFLKNTVVHGIKPVWNLLVGFPGEDEDVYRRYVRDIHKLHHLPPPLGVFPVRFDRYSPYFNKAVEYGLKLEPLDYYSLIYPFAREALREMAYYFGDTNYEAEYIAVTGYWLSDMVAAVKKWKLRWEGADGLLLPELYLERVGDEMVVYDSRSGQLQEYVLSKTQGLILCNLNHHKNRVAVMGELGLASDNNAVKDLEWLYESGLVFEENGTFMSLVMDSRPVPRSERMLYHS